MQSDRAEKLNFAGLKWSESLEIDFKKQIHFILYLGRIHQVPAKLPENQLIEKFTMRNSLKKYVFQENDVSLNFFRNFLFDF